MIKKIFYCYRTQYRVNRCALLWGEIIKHIPKIICCYNECGKLIFECCDNRGALHWGEVMKHNIKTSCCCFNGCGKLIFKCCANRSALLWGEVTQCITKIICCFN